MTRTKRKSARAARPPLLRMNWLDEQLRSHRLPTARKMKDEFEVTARTFFRDLAYLRGEGAPIAFDNKRGGYCYARDDFRLPAIRLSEGELLAVFVAEKVLQQYAGTPYEAALRSAFEKIVALLPDQVSVKLSQLGSLLSFDLGPVRPADSAMFALFTSAVRHGNRVHMTYYTAWRDEETARDLDPYHLYNYAGDWYVAGYDSLRNAVRDFALSRVLAARLTEERFVTPDDFDAQAHLSQAFGVEKWNAPPVTVRVRFDAHAARWVREKQWHPTQKVNSHKDGSLTLSFSVTGLDEVKRWVMQFGSHAEVLAPKSLRDAIADEVRDLAKTYTPKEGRS